jgi:hypothetical protein
MGGGAVGGARICVGACPRAASSTGSGSDSDSAESSAKSFGSAAAGTPTSSSVRVASTKKLSALVVSSENGLAGS